MGRNDLLIRTFLKGIMLKGYSATALLPDLLPLIGLAVIVIGVGLKSYRKTLD